MPFAYVPLQGTSLSKGHIFLDLWMCMVVYELKKGNLVGLILAEIRNSLDAFHRKEASFFTGSPLLL